MLLYPSTLFTRRGSRPEVVVVQSRLCRLLQLRHLIVQPLRSELVLDFVLDLVDGQSLLLAHLVNKQSRAIGDHGRDFSRLHVENRTVRQRQAGQPHVGHAAVRSLRLHSGKLEGFLLQLGEILARGRPLLQGLGFFLHSRFRLFLALLGRLVAQWFFRGIELLVFRNKEALQTGFFKGGLVRVVVILDIFIADLPGFLLHILLQHLRQHLHALQLHHLSELVALVEPHLLRVARHHDHLRVAARNLAAGLGWRIRRDRGHQFVELRPGDDCLAVGRVGIGGGLVARAGNGNDSRIGRHIRFRFGRGLLICTPGWRSRRMRSG